MGFSATERAGLRLFDSQHPDIFVGNVFGRHDVEHWSLRRVTRSSDPAGLTRAGVAGVLARSYRRAAMRRATVTLAVLGLVRSRLAATTATVSVALFAALAVPSSGALGPAARVVAPKFALPKLALRLQPPAPIEDLAAGDFNGDGLTDVLVVRVRFQTQDRFPVTVLLNKGNGKFVDGTRAIFDGTVPQTLQPRQVVIADFNGDRRPDVFIADTGMDKDPYPGAQNTLILSAPGGKLVDATANLPQQSDYTHSAAAADVDGNGTIDIYDGNLASGCPGCANVPPEILLNDGAGHFQIATNALPADVGQPSTPHYNGSALADVNGDGAPDLVLSGGHETSGNVLLLNDGKGHFSEVPNALPPKALGPLTEGLDVGTADVNGDGRNDLFMISTKWDPFYQGVWIQLLINNGDNTFTDQTATRLPQKDNTNPWIAFARPIDLNGDRRPDLTTGAAGLAVAGDSPSPTSTWINDGKGNFKPLKLPATAMGLYVWVNDKPRTPARDVLAVQPHSNSENYLFYRRLR